MKRVPAPVYALLLLAFGLVASSQSIQLREIATEFPVELEIVSVEEKRAPLVLVDDFDDSVLTSVFGGTYECGASSDDSTATCEIAWRPDGPSGGYLAFEYDHHSWMKLGLGGFPQPIDASGKEGIEVVLWSDSDIAAQLEIGTRDGQDVAAAYVSPRFAVGTSPQLYRIPFADQSPYGSGEAGIPENRLLRVQAIGFFPDESRGTLYVDDLGLYSSVAQPVRRDLVGQITRYASVGTIPFSVRYEAEFPDHEGLTYTWMTDPEEEADAPPANLYVVPDVAAPTDQGNSQTFIIQSNEDAFSIALLIEDREGRQYEWEDPGVDLPLHNHTQITLDATRFVSEEEIESVRWTAANGDPDDARTFPIADVSATTTTLVSEWPNVLEIECEIAKRDGSVVSEQVDALVYFRDGTPFEIRSVSAPMYHAVTLDQLAEIVEEQLPRLVDLGVNSITDQILWWFGPPDEHGNWEVHPMWLPETRGYTPPLENLDYYIGQARESGFQIHSQMLQYPYRNDTQLQQDYWGKYYPLRITDEFLYGDGQGYENMLRNYLPFFMEHDIDTVFLNGECGGMEKLGGSATREFFRDVIAEYREAGFTGAISYAAGISDDPVPYTWENLDPTVCGIPWADMDYVAFTYYPQLASTNDASTNEMYESARTQVDEFIRPFSEAYGKPVFVVDFYCFAFDGCAITPLLNNPSRVLDLEEGRRYHTAVLRAFSDANAHGAEPLVKGITMGVYSMVPDSWIPKETAREPGVPDVHYGSFGRRFNLLMKVFYRDVPLEGGNR